MLDAKELSKRLVTSMEEARPRVTSAALAHACGVTDQAVNGWRKNGRIAKRHLATIARITGKPLEYFLGSTAGTGMSYGLQLQLEEAMAIKKLREGNQDWRRYVLGLAMVEGSAQALLLQTMRQAVPDYKVEQAYGKPPELGAPTRK